jgi:hypothetical protein
LLKEAQDRAGHHWLRRIASYFSSAMRIRWAKSPGVAT